MMCVPLFRPGVVFFGLFFTATMAFGSPVQAPASSTPEAATLPQNKTLPAQDTSKKEPDKSGGWHHFGEPESARMTRRSGHGEMSRFDVKDAAPTAVPARSGARQPFGSGRTADLERQMWKLVNRDRLDPANAAETGGRAQHLRWNEKLAAVALAHSRDMLRHHYFDHIDREGKSPFARINAAGIHWRALAENIAINQTVAGAETSFMDEPRFRKNHRGNILGPIYTDVGIGIVQAPNGDLYITQDFASIPDERARKR